jgi:acetaldehyde dehydrogenase (acetylating)
MTCNWWFRYGQEKRLPYSTTEVEQIMTDFDNDLLSIQEARTLATQARDAQRKFLHATQAEVDRICAAMAQAAADAAVALGKMASEETGYGVPEHKTLKNLLSSQLLWEAIKDIPTVGVIRSDQQKRTYDIAWPMGVVAALTPSTNPTSTTMFKILISVKAKNGIVVAPHPFAAKCCVETARIMAEAGERAGMPKGLVNCMSRITLPGTQE